MLRLFDGHGHAATAGLEAEPALQDTRQQRLVDHPRRGLDAHRGTSSILHSLLLLLLALLVVMAAAAAAAAAVVVVVSFEV